MKHPTQRIRWRITLCSCWLLTALVLVAPTAAFAQEGTKPAEPQKRVTAQKPVIGDGAAKLNEMRQQVQRKTEKQNNPFDLLRQLFRGNEAPTPGADKSDDSDLSRAAHRKLRAGAPHDTETERQLRKAAAMMDEGNWELAMDLLQRQLDRSDDVSILLNDGNLVTARRQATRMLAEFPEEFRERYRLQYDGIAAQKLSAAVAANDLDEISEVANRYFHTPAGHEAANHIGTWHFDRGEFGMAALWFAQLLEARAKVAEDVKWRMKAALAYRQAGQLSDSEEILKEISSAGDAQLQLGGEAIDPDHWMLERGLPVTSIPPQLTEWPLFLGTPQRTGTATGGEPLLIPKWHEPLSHSHAIQQLTENLLDDLADQNMAPIPAWMPLMVDGKVIFRTLRGVLVVDAQTGRRLWETDVEQSPESVLTGQDATQSGQDARQQLRLNANGLINRFAYATAERHPLAGLLFANGTYGIISSDGEQLFVIEDRAVLSQQRAGLRVNRVDPNEASASVNSNRVVAYDLNSGRPIWSVGGEKMNEPFDPPLAGYYFNGVPVREGNDLFLVGEHSNEIRLFAVDPHTGVERWNQLVAIADEKIESDPFRRNWTSQVAVGDGVIVCPTTVGWLVGIDRLNHAALWAHRYSQPDLQTDTQRRAGSIADEQFNKRWCTSAPVISGNRVVFAPSEEPKLVCLDLFNGQVHWEKEKENFLYLAGVYGDCVLLVGSDSVAALSLKDGSNLWPPIQLPREDGPPTGVGVAVGEKYYLPLQDGQLWTVDLVKGAVVTRTYLLESEASLGNLAMYRGMLLSLNPLGVTSFEQRETVEKEIRERKAVDPLDVPALLRESDLQLLARDYNAALETLKKIDRSRVPAESNERYLSSMRTALEAAIRSDLAGDADEVETLTSIAESEDQLLEARRLAAQRFQARKEHLAAFDVLWELAQTDVSQFVAAGETRVRLDAWLAGQFANLWRDLSDAERTEFDGRLAKYAEQLPEPDRAKRELFVFLFAFRPVARQIEQQLVETYAKDGHFARAEQILLRRSADSDSEVAAAAVERLMRLTREFNLAADADYYARRLDEDFAQVKLPSGLTAGEYIAQLRREGTIGDADRPALADWKMDQLKISRTGTAYNSQSPQPLDFDNSQLPSFQRYAFELDQQRQRLTMLDRTDDSVYWMQALRGGATSGREPMVWAKAVGHRLIVQHRDIVHCISPVEREVLWTAPIDVRGRNNEFYRTATQQPSVSMRGGSAILSHSSILEQASHGGMTAIANNSYVCVHGRRQISVLDTETGAIRWTRTGIPQHSLVVGNSHTLFVVPPNRTESYALRASDGLRLDIADLGNILPRSIWLGDEGLLTIDVDSVRETDGASDRETIARLFDPISKVEHWKRTWKGRTHLSLLDDGRLAVLDAKSQLELIEPQIGRGPVFEALPEELVKVRADMYVVADPQQVYLIVNRPRPRGEFHTAYYSQEIPTIRVNGTLIALDVATRKKLWHRSIPAQGLIRNGLEQTPILLFTVRQSQSFEQIQYWRMNLLALDKRTGKTLLEEPTNGNYFFQSLQVSASGRYVELITNNQHIRLSASEGAAAAVVPESTPQP